MKFRFIPLVAFAIALAGCKTEHEACLSVNQPEYLCPGIPVQFNNCGPEDDDYSWDFGDSLGSTSFAPTHTYTTEDTFWVELTAGKDKKKVKDSLQVVVALPKASYLRLNTMPSLAPDGQSWDPSGGAPDLMLWIFDELGNTIFNTSQITNATLPLTFDMEGTTLCLDCTWNFRILDSQSGGDFDVVWDFTAGYDTLAKKRVWSENDGAGTTVDFAFEPR